MIRLLANERSHNVIKLTARIQENYKIHSKLKIAYNWLESIEVCALKTESNLLVMHILILSTSVNSKLNWLESIYLRGHI